MKGITRHENEVLDMPMLDQGNIHGIQMACPEKHESIIDPDVAVVASRLYKP